MEASYRSTLTPAQAFVLEAVFIQTDDQTLPDPDQAITNTSQLENLEAEMAELVAYRERDEIRLTEFMPLYRSLRTKINRNGPDSPRPSTSAGRTREPSAVNGPNSTKPRRRPPSEKSSTASWSDPANEGISPMTESPSTSNSDDSAGRSSPPFDAGRAISIVKYEYDMLVATAQLMVAKDWRSAAESYAVIESSSSMLETCMSSLKSRKASAIDQREMPGTFNAGSIWALDSSPVLGWTRSNLPESQRSIAGSSTSPPGDRRTTIIPAGPRPCSPTSTEGWMYSSTVCPRTSRCT